MFFNAPASVHLPRPDEKGYPLDLDGSLRFTRPFVVDVYPWPQRVGLLSGFMRQYTAFTWRTGFAKTPSGPNVNNSPTWAEYQIAVAGLTKFGAPG